MLQGLNLLTAKPVLYVCNVAEKDAAAGNAHTRAVEQDGGGARRRAVVISAAIEAEVAQLPDDEEHEFLEALGLHEPGLDRLIRAGYALLDLITFFTAGPKEARAWTVHRAPRRRRRRASSTPTSSAASSAPRPSPMTISSARRRSRRQGSRQGARRRQGLCRRGRRRDAVQVQHLSHRNRSARGHQHSPSPWHRPNICACWSRPGEFSPSTTGASKAIASPTRPTGWTTARFRSVSPAMRWSRARRRWSTTRTSRCRMPIAIRSMLASRGVRQFTVVLSHWHLDHIAGTAAFADCEMIANPRTAAHMQRCKAAIEAGTHHGPPTIDPLVMPTRLFEGELRLELGGREVRLIEANIHSDDATVIWLPDSRILLAGDTLEDTVTYVAEPENFERHLHDLDRLLALNPASILPNHGDPAVIAAGGYSADFITATQAYVRDLMRSTRRPRDALVEPQGVRSAFARGRLDPLFCSLRGRPPRQHRSRTGRPRHDELRAASEKIQRPSLPDRDTALSVT